MEISQEKAKELKEAGFPQRPCYGKGIYFAPTLERLKKECGKSFKSGMTVNEAATLWISLNKKQG